MGFSPQPPWPLVHIEIYDGLGFLDDCFRSSLWVNFQVADAQSFDPPTNIAGDYADMVVTEGAPINGAGWKRDIVAMALSTNDYMLIRIRIKGALVTPQYKVIIEYDDATSTDFGWIDAPPIWMEIEHFLPTAGKTIEEIKLLTRSSTINSQARVSWDFIAICEHPPLLPTETYDIEVDLRHTIMVSGFDLKLWNERFMGITDRRYTFDHESGIVCRSVFDYSRNVSPGVPTNVVTYPAGKFGGCVQFVSVLSTRISTSLVPNIPATGAYTIGFWVKADAGETGVIIGAGNSAGVWRRLQFDWSANKVHLYVRDGDGNVREYTTNATIADSTWHHLVGVIDPGNDLISVYVDGELDGSDSGTLVAIDMTGGGDYHLGCLNNSGVLGDYTDALVDEPIFLNRGLDAEYVKYLYQLIPPSGAARTVPGSMIMLYVAADGEKDSSIHESLISRAVLALEFDEGEGNTAYDSSPEGNNGTIVGASWVDDGLNFDGLNDYLTIPDSVSLRVNSFTIAYQINLKTIGFSYTAFPEKFYAAIFGGSIGVFFETNKTLIVRVHVAGVTQVLTVTNALEYGLHSYVFTRDETTGKIEVFRDGVSLKSQNMAPGNIPYDANVWELPRYYNKDWVFDVNEFLILPYVLTPTEIRRLYLAPDVATAVYKLFSGRVIDRVTGGDAAKPFIQLVCEDLLEVAHERTFTKEYTSATQISTIIDDIIDQALASQTFSGLYLDKDTTNRTIKNFFNREGCFALLQKLAQTATFGTGETGAHFFIDVGGSIRWRKFGSFISSETVTDGSDGNTPNILSIKVRESIKGEPKLVNDCQVVIFEEENYPVDKDAYTESAEGWSSPDPTDGGYPQSQPGDKVVGTASIQFNTTNPGTDYRMRIDLPDIDLAQYDEIALYFKHGVALTIDSIEWRLQKGSWTWTTDYFLKAGIADPGAAAWHFMNEALAGFAINGNPSSIINKFQIHIKQAVQIGTGGFLIDAIRFTKTEKYGSGSDAGSQAIYQTRTFRVVDKTITNIAFAGDLAGNIVANQKYPIVTILATVKGKAQVGYRPTQEIDVYSQKDMLDGATFQIQRALHRISPDQGYEVDLELIAARTGIATYSPDIMPFTLDMALEQIALRKRLEIARLSTLVSTNLV